MILLPYRLSIRVQQGAHAGLDDSSPNLDDCVQPACDMCTASCDFEPASQTANKAAMLYQAPPFMAALHGQPASQPIADNLIIITFDVVAQRLCARQHRAALCVLDSWETSKLGALVAAPRQDPRIHCATLRERSSLL